MFPEKGVILKLWGLLIRVTIYQITIQIQITSKIYIRDVRFFKRIDPVLTECRQMKKGRDVKTLS